MTIDQLKATFIQQYGQPAQYVYFCPGRVNLIGEHIDYNGGLVMPCAIDMGTWLLIAPNTKSTLQLSSINFDEKAGIAVSNFYTKQGKSWYNYPLGAFHYFAAEGHTPDTGLDLLYFGNLPVGSGLSSSASIEMVTAFALNDLTGAGYSKTDLVKLTKRVENDFIGVSTGVMDQFAVAYGEKDKAIQLNCENLDYKLVDIKLKQYQLAVINTNKPRNLAESKYNEWVSECQQALKQLQQELAVDYLCAITPAQYQEHEHLITDVVVRKRAQHVIEENDRVKHAAEFLYNGDLTAFGSLMYQSHQSLQTLYEVSGRELDSIVDFCRQYDGVIGARMTGAGFGGCAIALVKSDTFDDFEAKLVTYYTQQIGYAPAVYRTAVARGVHQISA